MFDSTAAVNQHDLNNYEVSRRLLGSAAQLPDDIIRLYQVIYKALLPELKTDPQQIAAVFCVHQNVKHLTTGINSLYRLYVSQMFREIRSAVEATGIAKLIIDDPVAYTTFVRDRPEDQKARKKSIDTFRSVNIFSKINPYLAVLKDHYDTASMMAHTNVMTSIQQHISPVNEGIQSRFALIEIPPHKAQKTLSLCLGYTCLAHFDIIEAITNWIFPSFNTEEPSFESLYQNTHAKFEAHSRENNLRMFRQAPSNRDPDWGLDL